MKKGHRRKQKKVKTKVSRHDTVLGSGITYFSAIFTICFWIKEINEIQQIRILFFCACVFTENSLMERLFDRNLAKDIQMSSTHAKKIEVVKKIYQKFRRDAN